MLETTTKYMIPETGRRVDYSTYRQVTGKCETCGVQMEGHPECDSCGVLCGIGHLDSLSPYRRHKLCWHCIVLWENLDKVIGRETTWQEFRLPQPRMFPLRIEDHG